LKLTGTLLEEPRDDNVPFIIAPEDVIDVAVEVATVGQSRLAELMPGEKHLLLQIPPAK